MHVLALPILQKDWYLQPTMLLAREVLGKILVTQVDGQLTAGRIVEVEPYFGAFDKASHAYPTKLTPRTSVVFGGGGHAYIFRCHMYWQLNFVTGAPGTPDCVLVRGIEPLEGREIMRERRQRTEDKDLGSGPGKLCMAMGIDKSFYGTDMTKQDAIWLCDDGTTYDDKDISCASRVGIHYAEEYALMPWRFYKTGSDGVSRTQADAPTFAQLRESLLGNR